METHSHPLIAPKTYNDLPNAVMAVWRECGVPLNAASEKDVRASWQKGENVLQADLAADLISATEQFRGDLGYDSWMPALKSLMRVQAMAVCSTDNPAARQDSSRKRFVLDRRKTLLLGWLAVFMPARQLLELACTDLKFVYRNYDRVLPKALPRDAHELLGIYQFLPKCRSKDITRKLFSVSIVSGNDIPGDKLWRFKRKLLRKCPLSLLNVGDLPGQRETAFEHLQDPILLDFVRQRGSSRLQELSAARLAQLQAPPTIPAKPVDTRTDSEVLDDDLTVNPPLDLLDSLASVEAPDMVPLTAEVVPKSSTEKQSNEPSAVGADNPVNAYQALGATHSLAQLRKPKGIGKKDIVRIHASVVERKSAGRNAETVLLNCNASGEKLKVRLPKTQADFVNLGSFHEFQLSKRWLGWKVDGVQQLKEAPKEDEIDMSESDLVGQDSFLRGFSEQLDEEITKAIEEDREVSTQLMQELIDDEFFEPSLWQKIKVFFLRK